MAPLHDDDNNDNNDNKSEHKFDPVDKSGNWLTLVPNKELKEGVKEGVKEGMEEERKILTSNSIKTTTKKTTTMTMDPMKCLQKNSSK